VSQYFGIDYKSPKVSALSVEGIVSLSKIATSPKIKEFCQFVIDTFARREEAARKMMEEIERKIELKNREPLTRNASKAVLVSNGKDNKPMQTTGILQKQFHETTIDFRVDENEQLWITAELLGQVLGYTDPAKSINRIINRHKDILAEFTRSVKLTDLPTARDTTIISEQGVYMICMKANTPAADDFCKWLGKLALDYHHGRLQYANPAIGPDFIRELYARMGPYQTNQYLRKALNLKDTPANIVKDLLLALEFTKGDFNRLRVKYRYIFDSQFYIDINNGSFKDKERLAADLGVTVQDIWG